MPSIGPHRSLIETCKLNKVDPLTYLTDVLTRIVNGHPNSEIDQFRGPTTSRPQSCGLITTLTSILRTETVLDVVREPLRSFYRGRLARRAAARLLLRMRLATVERRRFMPRHLIPLSKLKLIARISRSKTSQNLICETNTAGVDLLAVNKWSCVFAAWIALSECCSALSLRPA